MAAALDKHAKIFLPGLSSNSLQGDSVLHHIAPHFGIKSTIQHNGILIENQQPVLPTNNSFNLINHPDLAPALICTACALNLPYRFTGLETLQFKESNRLVALQTELKKTGCVFSGNSNELMIEKGIETVNGNVVLHTYNDHRLAMAFAMLSLLQGKVAVDNLFVTEKSYPLFTKHLLQNNFVIFTA
jgi:3-phosphoshikimate 1-carboxyvinyltransferase